MNSRSIVRCGIVLGLATGCAQAQLINDGTFDSLAVGTPPDNAAAAGAWGFPANYITNVLGEVSPTDYQIVPANSFQTGATGNAMAMSVNNATANIHLPNVLPAVINEAPNQIIRARFHIWVGAGGPGGGSIYIGGDMGGGGFSNASDRGPQLSLFPNGTITHAHLVGTVVTNTVIVPSYVATQWQNFMLDIRLDVDRFNAYHSAGNNPLIPVGTSLAFRSTPLNKIDRVTFAHFGATIANSVAYYDDVSLQVLCYTDCNEDGLSTVADFGCYQTRFVAGDPYGDCNGDGMFTVADFGCFQTRFVVGCP